MSKTISEYDGNNGKARIYSAHDGQIIMAHKCSFEDAHKLEKAIRLAEEKAFEAGCRSVKHAIYQALDKI